MPKRKQSSKKRKTSKKKDSKLLPYILLILIFTLLSTFSAYYFLTKEKIPNIITTSPYFEEETKDLDIEYKTTKIQLPDIKEMEKQEQQYEYIKEDIKEKKKEALTLPNKDIKLKIEDIIAKPIIKKIKKIKNKIIKPIDNRPKLAIICDDVTTAKQVRQINNIGYDVTMSFLPPTPRHKRSASIAQNISFYMIHLPLEAKSTKFEEKNTLKINNSYKKIEKRISALKAIYPNTKYINNHTGSKFTSNNKAMDNLMRALKKHNFIFIDSRTTAKSVAAKYAKKYSVPFLSRNIFLDNKADKNYIQNQLRKAVKIAKRDGFAIAICHPHGITLKTLKQSKALLKDVHLILVNKI